MSEDTHDPSEDKRSRFKRNIVPLTAIGLLVVVVIVWVGVHSNLQQDGSSGTTSFVVLSTSPEPSAENPTSAAISETEVASSDRIESTPNLQVLPSDLWTEIDETAVNLQSVPPYPFVVENRRLVRLYDSLWEKELGNTIDIYIPQLQLTINAEIQSVNRVGRTITYEGRYTDDGRDFPFVITLGERSAFAHLPTSRGSYELFGNRNYAWLMPTEHMDDHVDYSLPDHFYVDPDPRNQGARKDFEDLRPQLQSD